MSDTAVNDTLSSFFLDGEAPRLASPPPPPTRDVTGDSNDEDSSTETGTPLLPAPSLGIVPLLTALDGPSLPTPTEPTLHSAELPGTVDPEPAHPMAHLMQKTQSETSAWAAELRAAKKRKARKIKIGLSVGFLAAAALIGPPLGSWLWNAINEAGGTSPKPAATEPAPAPTTAVAADVSVPATSAPTGLAGLAGLPGAASDAVDATNAAAGTPAPTVAP